MKLRSIEDTVPQIDCQYELVMENGDCAGRLYHVIGWAWVCYCGDHKMPRQAYEVTELQAKTEKEAVKLFVSKCCQWHSDQAYLAHRAAVKLSDLIDVLDRDDRIRQEIEPVIG